MCLGTPGPAEGAELGADSDFGSRVKGTYGNGEDSAWHVARPAELRAVSTLPPQFPLSPQNPQPEPSSCGTGFGGGGCHQQGCTGLGGAVPWLLNLSLVEGVGSLLGKTPGGSP